MVCHYSTLVVTVDVHDCNKNHGLQLTVWFQTQACSRRQGGRCSGGCVCIVNIYTSVMDCTGIHQVVDIEWKFGGNISFLFRICVTLYISSSSLKGFRLFSIACVALAYIFLILTVLVVM